MARTGRRVGCAIVAPAWRHSNRRYCAARVRIAGRTVACRLPSSEALPIVAARLQSGAKEDEMRRHPWRAVRVATFILVGSACLETVQAAPPHNAVTLWHERTQPVIATWTGRGNAAQAYTSALVQIAVYDAAVAIRGGYRPFYAEISAPFRANLDAAIATAAYRVTRARVNIATPARNTLDSQYAAYMAVIPDGQSKDDGIAVGEAAAAATLAARAGDNFYNAALYENPPADPGVWQATSVASDNATAGANDYQMSFTIPVTAASPGARRAPAPVAMDKQKYAKALHDVQETGGKAISFRTMQMTDVVQFWTESGFTLWTRNTRDIVIARGLDELESARALAIVGLAGGEAMLACWDAKYHYMNWRPFQAIQRADEDGNTRTDPEPAWAPLVRANHPEYPAGHGCYGSAMVTALKKLFEGDFPVTLTSTGNQVVGHPVVPARSYESLAQVTDDVANARVWGGLHFRTTMDVSARWIKGVVRDALKGQFKRVEMDDHDEGEVEDIDDSDSDN